jgi:hypothetical protein
MISGDQSLPSSHGAVTEQELAPSNISEAAGLSSTANPRSASGRSRRSAASSGLTHFSPLQIATPNVATQVKMPRTRSRIVRFPEPSIAAEGPQIGRRARRGPLGRDTTVEPSRKASRVADIGLNRGLTKAGRDKVYLEAP